MILACELGILRTFCHEAAICRNYTKKSCSFHHLVLKCEHLFCHVAPLIFVFFQEKLAFSPFLFKEVNSPSESL